MNVRFISIECCHDATLYALCVSIQTINTLCVAISLNTGEFEWKIAKISWLLSLWSFMITYCVHSLFYLIFKKTHVSQAIAIYLADFFPLGVYVCIFFNLFSWSNVHTVRSARACTLCTVRTLAFPQSQWKN